VLARWHRTESWKLFTEALESDVGDVQGGTTPEGIHLGAMAGTVDVVQRCYAGIAINDDVLCFDPLLPHEVARLKMRLHYRGHNLDLHIRDGTLRITVGKSPASAIRIGVGGEYYELRGGETREFI
jgi:alpha,alpha-trehalase